MIRDVKRLDVEMIRCVNHFSGRLLRTSGGQNNKCPLIGKKEVNSINPAYPESLH